LIHFYKRYKFNNMVNLEVLQSKEEPTITKKEKNKQKKLKDVTNPIENNELADFNQEEKIGKKKKKKNKRKAENGDQDEVVTKKKKKNEDTEIKVFDEENSSDSKDSGIVSPSSDPEEECPFQKKFYTMSSKTESMSKAEVKQYYKTHNTVLKGKGRKTFKPLLTFNELGFPAKIMKVCEGFSNPTPIQSLCWPIAASGRDVIGIAETGSGKTLAFSIPGLAHLSQRVQTEGRNGLPMMLIVAPTRELAMQSQDVLEVAGRCCGVRSLAVYGGVAKYEQRKALQKGVEVVVATPGRLIDFMQEGVCDLSQVSYLVLDEADRMLDQGFERDVRAIIAETHPQRQTCLFSATWPETIRALAHEFLKKPIRVTVGSEDIAAGTRIKQLVEVVEDRDRENKLIGLLKKHHGNRTDRVLIFVLYKKEAARIEANLQRKGWNCTSIHGDKSQEMRTKAMEDFKSGKIPLLVATDVASRGLDIPDVDFVVNYSFPLTIEDYVHRIGRTGRAGKSGTAYTFFQTVDKARAGELVKILKEANQTVPKEMMQFDLNIKKKEHKLYGAFGPKDYALPMKKATKITFD